MGSQCKVFINSVTCSNFLHCDTIRAAIFWIPFSGFRTQSGIPARRESILEELKASTNFSASDCERNLRILLIDFRYPDADRHTLEMCFSMFNWESKMAPRFLALSVASIAASRTRMTSTENFSRLNFSLDRSTNSVSAITKHEEIS